MASIFNSLHIGYSGLNAAQVGVDVTSHNIANVDTEGYTRQRVVTSAAHPVSLVQGVSGNGVQITEIASIFDKFVFDRFVSAGDDKANSDFKRSTLEELSTYFPDIDGVGIKADLNRYFNLWQSFADNPDNEAMKIALAQQTQTLSQNISQTRDQVSGLQDSLDAQMVTYVDEVNMMAEEITHLNISINEIESISSDNANDLRDRRNLLEESIAKLVGGEAFDGLIESNTSVDTNIATDRGTYSLQVAGFNIIDGGSFHPIGATNDKNAHGFHDLYYMRQDGVKIPFEQTIKGGKIGAILELRGSEVNSLTNEPEDGTLQDTINMLDAFAQGLIENTNNIYAQSATTQMDSSDLNFRSDSPLINTEKNFQEGSFDIVIYDIDGNQVATRNITLNAATVMGDSSLDEGDVGFDARSIVGQIKVNSDDNDDGSAINDVDDFIDPVFMNPSSPNNDNGLLSFALKSGLESQGYTFSIVDSDTQASNFAGAIGMHRFFDGSSAKDIELNRSLAADTSKISAAKAPVSGDNQVATMMVAMQFEDLNFYDGEDTYTDSIYGFYDSIVTKVGTTTNAEIIRNDSITAQYNAVSLEFDSISKVSIDEELTNLIRYQTAYGAASKVISTIDQMMQTLLGIKQ
ncbi:MAG: flagellar hook-associated protein FlgK [Campylobacterota bacterium]|nr:flagellar hook-associated protein FlgK [Campylobacterota bacterium]